MKQVEMECGIAPWIPLEVIRSIFKRLPVRTLIKWQFVCKDWKDLLNDPSFIQEHLQYSADTNPSLLFCRLTFHSTLEFCTVDSEMQVLPIESLSLIEFLRGATVIGSINGLVCVKSTNKFNILVWNPAISKFRLLTKETNICATMGFGFCSIVKDYKVEIISHHGYSSTGLIHQVEVYSLSTHSWKKVEFGRLLDDVEISCDGFGTNGAIFWLGFKKGNVHVLISYYIATEEFALIPTPISAPELIDSLICTLSVYENKLALLSHTTSGNFEYTLCLWVMEESKHNKSEERWSWTKKYSVKHPYYFRPSTVWRNMIVCKDVEELRERKVDKLIGDGIVLVNLTTDKLKWFAVRRYGIDFETLHYVESLVPVDKIHIEEL
ncbi:hypothetical protein QN277_009501 [Acacia crassicarpa]|nr:hypothetical protein QN277_009501 [Acacia crassicarpa]